MAKLINRNEPQKPIIQESANTERTVVNNKNTAKQKLDPKDRKNIKVSPSSFALLKTVSTLQSKKNYELIDEMIEYYVENNLTEREQRMLKNIIANQEN